MSDTSKQTKQTARKAAAIRRLREKGLPWSEVTTEIGILTEDGRPDPGLAYKIAYEGYEPKGKEIRARLGLKNICIECMRAIRKSSGPRGALAPWLRWWRGLTPGDREERIREEYEKERR